LNPNIVRWVEISACKLCSELQRKLNRLSSVQEKSPSNFFDRLILLLQSMRQVSTAAAIAIGYPT
jgi:hypothetical protein